SNWLIGLQYKEEHWGFDRELASDRQWKLLGRHCISYDVPNEADTPAHCDSNPARLSLGNPTGFHISSVAAPETWRTTKSTYDSYGNLLVTINPRGKRSTREYTPDGYFLHQQTNALGQSVTYDYEAAFGALESSTDANQCTTTLRYDSFG